MHTIEKNTIMKDLITPNRSLAKETEKKLNQQIEMEGKSSLFIHGFLVRDQRVCELSKIFICPFR